MTGQDAGRRGADLVEQVIRAMADTSVDGKDWNENVLARRALAASRAQLVIDAAVAEAIKERDEEIFLLRNDERERNAEISRLREKANLFLQGAAADKAEARREERAKVLLFLFEHGRLTRKEADRLDQEMNEGPLASAPDPGPHPLDGFNLEPRGL